MKVIIIEPITQYNNTADCALLKCTDGMSIHTLADTALLTHGKPMFVPDYGGECSAKCCAVARIGRLGKSIPERFAYRYCDGVTVGVKFELRGLRRELSQCNLPCDVATSFDGAATVGDFTEYAPCKAEAVRFKVEAGEQVRCNVQLGETNPSVSKAISAVSRYFTIRQGDVLFIPLPASEFAVSPDTHITGSIDGKKVLKFNVK